MENNSIVPVKKNDNAIVSISNQISLTNKLLANVERGKVFKFLIQRPEFAINLISCHYPLNETILEKHKNKWAWYQLSYNKSLEWSDILIDKYKGKWDWDHLSQNQALPWSEVLFDKFSDKWNWKSLNRNGALPWSETFIDKYKDKWDWSGLSYCKAIPWSEGLIDKYKDKWYWSGLSQNVALPWSEAFFDKYEGMWAWNQLSYNNAIPWSETFIDKHIDKWDWDYLSGNQALPWSETFLGKYNDKWYWYRLSGNQALSWSEAFFDKYKDKWDWDRLSGNGALSWSEDFIDTYKDRWNWESLSYNMALPWSEAFFDKYKEKWDWESLSYNTALPWSGAFIDKFKAHWDLKSLSWSNQVWDKVFKPYLNDQMVDEIMEELERDKNDLSHFTGTVTDIDGNVYHTVKIGTQWWMVENFRTSRYRDGSAITEIKDDTSWANVGQSKKAAWCYYDNNAQNNPTYGKLYNWYAVADPRGLCPVGWHVPSDEEFQILVDYLGGSDVAGGKMKAQTLWDAPNTCADNSSGFAALPASDRNFDGTFGFLGDTGCFWSSTEANSSFAWNHVLGYDHSNVIRTGNYRENGLSVRCVKD